MWPLMEKSHEFPSDVCSEVTLEDARDTGEVSRWIQKGLSMGLVTSSDY